MPPCLSVLFSGLASQMTPPMEGPVREDALTAKFGYRTLNDFAAMMPEALIEQIKAEPRVMFVEPEQRCTRR